MFPPLLPPLAAALSLLPFLATALNSDASLLFAFKSSILADPLSVLADWTATSVTPCSWNGVTCTTIQSIPRAISIFLPNAHLLGSIPQELGLIEHLRHLDLSSNYLNGTLPASLFNSTNLRILSLANNEISGAIPELHHLSSLQSLNLSDNALSGSVPGNLTPLPNLIVLSLANNYLSGGLPTGLSQIEILDLSSNLINSTIPRDLAGDRLQYLNLSYNRLTGASPPETAARIPAAAIVDISHNNLSGEIPSSAAFKPNSLAGNPDLCGKPLRNLCTIPSTLSTSTPRSPAALAAIPDNPRSPSASTSALKPAAILAIIAGDVAGIAFLFVLFLYVYKAKKRNQHNEQKQKTKYESSADSETEPEDAVAGGGGGSRVVALVTVDGEDLELETLLKASAYILGAAGASIVYKAVLADGTALAVRRIGDGGGGEKIRDFEAQVRSIAKLRHPNLLRIRGFYWGVDEKLLIHDYAANGSLAGIFVTKKLSWNARLTIARGIARGLAFLHDKKCVHGSIKPSNILLNDNMEPLIGDFGLERLMDSGSKSTRNFGSKRSTQSLPELSPSDTVIVYGISPYQAPEALKSLKPSTKLDVYSFGVVLLELLAGRLFTEMELCAGFVAEERNRVLRLADPGLRNEMAGKEDAMLVCFKLGFACAAVVPQRRPTMKDVIQVIGNVNQCSNK